MSHSLLAFRAVLLALGLAATPRLASAQGRSAEDAKAIATYRLTMPMLRKVLPALREMATASCQERRRTDPDSLSLAEMTRRVKACPPVMQSLRQAGVEAADAALLYAALLHTGHELARRGGEAAKLPPGVTRDNALLLEQHEPELRKLTTNGGQS